MANLKGGDTSKLEQGFILAALQRKAFFDSCTVQGSGSALQRAQVVTLRRMASQATATGVRRRSLAATLLPSPRQHRPDNIQSPRQRRRFFRG
jgi:hypothetical protein